MNYKVSIKRYILLFVPLMFLSCEKEVIQKDFDRALEQLVAHHALPSLSAAIFKENETVWTTFYGYADIKNEREADEETIYHIGSISKLFIVTAVMQLKEQGKLDLNQDVSTYLPVVFRHPGFPDIPITAKMLLTHTAGLSWPKSYDSQKGMWNPFEPDQGPAPNEWIPEFLIPGGIHYDPGLWKNIRPGDYEFYSNIGTCVAAYVVEQLSGMDFREYCKKYIFDPLKMYNTSYNYGDLDWEKIALLYDRQGHASAYFDNRIYASGGAKSTIVDLSHFAICYFNKGTYQGTRILNEETIDQIFEIHNPASGKCLIWNRYSGDWYGHSGGLDLGTTTMLSIHSDSKTGFILFTNTPSGLVDPGGDIYWLIRQKTNEYIDR